MTCVTNIGEKAVSLALTTPPGNASVPSRKATLIVVEDGDELFNALEPACEYLGVGIERLSSHADLESNLYASNPMGVVASLDSSGQDGCHIMMTVAKYDRRVPILMVTGDEANLAGAVDAVEEITGLETVVTSRQLPTLGALVDFIFRCGRKGRCLRLIPA